MKMKMEMGLLNIIEHTTRVKMERAQIRNPFGQCLLVSLISFKIFVMKMCSNEFKSQVCPFSLQSL